MKATLDNIIEAIDILDNERGAGEPPVPGFTASRIMADDGSRNGARCLVWSSPLGVVRRQLDGWWWQAVPHPDQVYHRGEFLLSGRCDYARDGMRLVAGAGKEKA